MDLLTAFAKIPKNELTNIAQPDWLGSQRSQPINLNFNKKIVLPIEINHTDGSVSEYEWRGNGILINKDYVTQNKEEG